MIEDNQDQNEELENINHDEGTNDEISSTYEPILSEAQILQQKLTLLKEECSKLLVDQDELIELMMTCIISGGHILLEGVPGIAKTLSAKVLAKSIDAEFSRIQFTPDLLPADIIGTSIYKMKDSEFVFEKGPVFSNIVLIDEINRAPAKTQAALFEVMEEKQISYDGEQYKMDFPFVVIATQNPIDQEGTYKLPEAQLDRFLMKLKVNYPNLNAEVNILKKFNTNIEGADLSKINAVFTKEDLQKLQEIASKVYIEDQLFEYIGKLVQESRTHGKLYLGASPRSSLAILRTAKVQAAIQGDQVRITGKKRDDLQEAIALVKGADLGQPFQFNNFRD